MTRHTVRYSNANERRIAIQAAGETGERVVHDDTFSKPRMIPTYEPLVSEDGLSQVGRVQVGVIENGLELDYGILTITDNDAIRKGRADPDSDVTR